MVSSSSFNVSTRNVVDINRSSSSSSSLRRSCRMAAQTQTQAQADYTCTNSNSSTRAQQTLMNQKRCRHLYAQKLNNCASICIETGLYDRAILSLSKALKLSEQEEEEQDEPKQEQEQDNQDDDDDDDDVIMEDKNAAVSETDVEEDDEFEYEEEDEEDEMMICPCYHCTVDGCIEYSETNSDNNDDAFFCQTIGADASFIYRRPIQVTPQSIQDGHNMGSTLCLIIAFNLALAYHLKAISTTTIITSSSSSSSSKGKNQKYITVALKLYVHVIRWQTRLIRQQNSNNYSYYNEESNIHSGMRFKMILLSNMSQLHRQQNQTQNENETLSSQSQSQSSSSPYQLCLESLLSNIMLVVEYKTRIFNHNIASSSSSSPSSLPYIMIADLEQFLQNTSPILMGRNSSCSSSSSSNGNGNVQQDQCASAA